MCDLLAIYKHIACHFFKILIYNIKVKTNRPHPIKAVQSIAPTLHIEHKKCATKLHWYKSQTKYRLKEGKKTALHMRAFPKRTGKYILKNIAKLNNGSSPHRFTKTSLSLPFSKNIKYDHLESFQDFFPKQPFHIKNGCHYIIIMLYVTQIF